jgi:hypothetical protein
MQAKASMTNVRALISLVIALLLISLLLLPIPLQADDTDILINEIMYQPNKGTPENGHEWIEIYNRGSTSVDLTDWRFYEDSTNHTLTLRKGSMTIPSGGYAVIANNADTFLSDYSGYTGTLIDSSWSALVNDGESLALKNSSFTAVDQVDYSSAWGGGSGISLECIDPNSDNNMSSNWGSSLTTDGTPGAENSIYNPTSVILSSFTARPTSFQASFFHWQWLVLACAAGLVFGGGAMVRNRVGAKLHD